MNLLHDIILTPGSGRFINLPSMSASSLLCTDSAKNLSTSGCGGGGAALSALSAALGSNTIANGNNPQIWQWHVTSGSTNGFQLTESSASTGIGGSLFNLSTLLGSTVSPLTVQNSLSGSQTLPAAIINPTWNTTGNADALQVNVINTASGASSKLLNLKVSGIAQYNVDPSGNSAQLGTVNSVGGFIYNGTAPSGDVLCGNGTAFIDCTPGRVTVNETGSGTILTFAQSDNNKLYTQANSGTSAYTLPIVSSLSNGWSVAQMNMGAGTTTTSITTSTATVCGPSSCSTAQTSFALTTGQFALVYSNSSGYFVKIF